MSKIEIREYETHCIRFINADNHTYLSNSNKIYDLSIDDPCYGINASKPSEKPHKTKQKNGNVLNVKKTGYKIKDWDEKPTAPEYFDLLIKKTKNQIIFGVNFYNYQFGPGRIIWDKLNGKSDQFAAEIMYNSLNNRTDIIYYMWHGFMQGKTPSFDVKKALIQQGDKSKNEARIHPTQKPVLLYDFIYLNYVKKDWTVFDGHGGSGSHAIAAHKNKINLDIVEKDKEIFNDMVKRFDQLTAQTPINYE